MEWLYLYLALGLFALALAINGDDGELFGNGKYPLRVRLTGSAVVILIWPVIVIGAAAIAMLRGE